MLMTRRHSVPSFPGCPLSQIADPTFFMKTLPLLDDGDDIAMVLSPQCFHNVHHQADIFNHTNIHFWEYMQIGYDALSFISCTGAVLLRACSASCRHQLPTGSPCTLLQPLLLAPPVRALIPRLLHRHQLPHPRQCIPRVRLVADMDPH